MKHIINKSRKLRIAAILAPLALLVVLAIAVAGYASAGSSVYCTYGNCGSSLAPNASYGISNQLLYVANGLSSNVKVIDVGTMNIVDTIPVPNEAAPAGIHALNPSLMNWETHGVVPSADHKDIYAVGALNGGSWSTTADTSSTFQMGVYKAYKINTATKTLDGTVPLEQIAQATDPKTGAPEVDKNGNPVMAPTNSMNPVGYCGLQYNLNDVNSNYLVAASMNADDATLSTALKDPNTGQSVNLGRPAADQTGGWTTVNLSTGQFSSFMSADYNGNLESSTCGIAWNANGTQAYASQMFEPLIDTVNWNAAAATGTLTGSIGALPNTMYHQETTDKAKGHLFVSEENNIDVYDMSTNTQVATINVYGLLGATKGVHTHSVAFTNAGGKDVLYATVRNFPVGSASEIVLDVSNLSSPVLIGSISGLDPEACGVYADTDKSQYYEASGLTANAQVAPEAPHNALNNDLLFVANGRSSNVKVLDPGSLKIVDTIPVPNEQTPAGLHAMNPGLMNWEVHSIVVSKDRTKIYTAGALSGGSYQTPGDTSSPFQLADYQLYTIGTANKTLEAHAPLAGPNDPVNLVGYCGMEFNLNNENSNILVASSMNASNATLKTALKNPDGTPFDAGGARGSGHSELGGWSSFNLSTGQNIGFVSGDGSNLVDALGNVISADTNSPESSTCGITWNAAGTDGYASQMFQPLVNKINWDGATGTGTSAGVAFPASTVPGTMYHQEAMDKATGMLFIASSSGNIDVMDSNTGAIVGAIDVSSLVGTQPDVHGIEMSPSDPSVLYVTARNTPNAGHATELILKVGNEQNPATTTTLLGAIPNLDMAACGVYAIGDKATWQAVQDTTAPSLALYQNHVYWGSMADYQAGKLSVDWSISAGATSSAASGVTVVGAHSTNGVSLASAMPLNIGDIGATGSAGFTLQYNVPSGVSVFMTSTYATADGGTFTYPGPYTP